MLFVIGGKNHIPRFLVAEREAQVISISWQFDLFTEVTRKKYKEPLVSWRRSIIQTALILNQRYLQSKI